MDNKEKQVNPGKKNIGLFMALLDNPYCFSVLTGAIRGAKECDANLVVFPVEILAAKYAVQELNSYRYQYNIFTDFMHNHSLDGIVVEYATITSFLPKAESEKFLKLAADNDMIVLSEPVEGYASVCTENSSGICDVMQHLIVDHGYKKIAFLAGTKGNSDSELRLATYRFEMKKHNLYTDDNLVVYGNFSEIVDEPMNELLANHPDVEAIVSANDGMAMATMQYLREHGRVPVKDIFITGFDNIPAGILEDPSLTTVRANPDELSRVAVHELCKPVFKKRTQFIKTDMIKRESCGCNECNVSDRAVFELSESGSWREAARIQVAEKDYRHRLERELGNATRELVFTLKSDKDRYKGILEMMNRFEFKSCALFLYDEFITHKATDVWTNPEIVNLVGYYHNRDNNEYFILDKGELRVPVDEIFNWGVVREGNRKTLFVLPLFFGEIQMGFMAIESKSSRAIHAYDIAGQVSNILYTVAMKEALENASQSKNHFLANMSHEIRTPINAIIGFNEMILRENKEPSISEYASDVKNAADTLLMLVNDILDFSKIEAGKMELIISEYNLGELLRGIVGMMTMRAENKGLALFMEYDENLPAQLEGDSGRLQQILINLVSNAIKYTEKGKVTVKVSGVTEGDNITLTFRVIDTGIGIKEEDITRLFTRFERIEEKRNRNIEGTGLGINISTGLLKLMDSKLEVKSDYGHGSEFSFSINQKILGTQTIGKSLKPHDESKKAGDYPSFVAPGKKILVVDDNSLNRKVIKSLLKDTELVVDQAEGGQACIDMVKQTKYDMILLDHMMPNMDGIETFEILMKEKLINMEETPVIALTANAIAGAREEYLSIGFTNYLAKPVLPKDLFAMLIEYLKA